MFQIDKDHPPSVGPISQRYKWCCNNGCGECTPVLVEFRTYHSTLNGATDQERTEPRMVSRCCGEGMFLWDTTLDDDGPMGYDGALAGPPQKTQQPALSTAPNNPPMPEHWGVVVSVNGDNILCIGESYLHGKRELNEAEENAVIGVAQHLLAFVGYGLPPSSFDPDADDAARTAAQPETTHQVATQPTAPSMTLPAERSLFKEQFRHLDLEEMPDAWGRPVFKHSHVDAIWHGWRQRAAIALLDTHTRPSPTAQAAPAGATDQDGEAFRTAARLGLTLRFYGGCAQSSMPNTPSAYEVVAGGDRSAAMREAVQRAAAVIESGGESQRLDTTAQAAPAADYDHGPQSLTVAEAARHVGKWLNERPNRPLDLRDVAMLCAHAQKAPAAGAVARKVFLVATGEEHEGEATYTRYDDAPPPLCDSECLYTAAPTPAAQADGQPAPGLDESTPGEWFVRKLVKDGELRGCFVAAPDYLGMPYDAEILGDDEYRDKPESDETSGMRRRLADCELIVAAVKHYRAARKQGGA